MLRKTCGDREEDRVVEQRIELVFRDVQRVALSIQGEAVAARKLLESTSIDLSIVHLEAGSDDRRLTIDFDGFIDGVSCDSARLVVDAESIELVYAND